jgi:ankyrin repeat protein
VSEKKEFIYPSDAPSHFTFLTPECSLSENSFFAVLNNCQDWNSALMLAARYGHVKASRLLLKSKADVNAAGQVRAA